MSDEHDNVDVDFADDEAQEQDAQGDAEDVADKDEDYVFAVDVGDGLAAVEAHDFEGSDFSDAFGDVDVVEIEEDYESEGSGADDDHEDDVI